MKHTIEHVTKIAKLLSINDHRSWPVQHVRIAPEIWDFITQVAQDSGSDESVVVNVWLAAHMLRIDNDET